MTCVFCSVVLVFGLSSLLQLNVVASQPVHCTWAQWSPWSVCDPCSRKQTQTRLVWVYPQFGGTQCADSYVRTQGCESAQGCPLDEGCGERFRCGSGKCVSQALVCNGDVDCEEDGHDEQRCDTKGICDLQKPPPQIELTGLGFDSVRGQLRGSVINTKSFGGQCRKIFSGDHRSLYRLPQSVLKYSFQVTARNDFSSELYESYWHYSKKIENRETTTGTTWGHSHFTSNEELTKINKRQLVEISSDVEVAQFQNQPPEYLPLAEEFWRALSSLPVVYDYAAYRKVLERFGTHFLSEGTLGGRFEVLMHLSRDFIQKSKIEIIDFKECVKTTHTVLFFIKWSTTRCNDFYKEIKNQADNYRRDNHENMIKNNAIGGHLSFISRLNALNLANPEENMKTFSMWAGSVKDFPTIITQKIRPLYELVKEVSCAGVKKFHLRRATETYLSEEDSCRCQPCRNNGLAVLRDQVCVCVCKAGTEGLACERGVPIDEQPGVIHGGWSCWSSWSSCSSGARSRSRSCTRPAPQNGKSCAGNAVETGSCEEEEELKYLRSMEPHCFDLNKEPRKTCRNPPPLTNAFVLNLRDVYAVGSKVEYSCIDGFHLTGNPIAECTEQQTWSRQAMECKSTTCDPPKLPPDVTASPWKLSYSIGEAVTLSCSSGSQTAGSAEIRCNSGLDWSPSVEDTQCLKVTTVPPLARCQPWEDRAKETCVCKIPHQCEPSLEVCVLSARGRTSRLSVCKLRALQCLGHQYTVAEHSACEWPEAGTAATCPECSLWTTCDESTGSCRCKTLDECWSSQRWIDVCVKLDEESPASTLTECEVGVRRCRGETPHLVSLGTCEVLKSQKSN